MNATFKRVVIAIMFAGASVGASSSEAMESVERRVNAFSTYRYHYDAYSGEFVIVNLRGDTDTDLDLVVRDSDGRIVCQSLGPWDVERCTFRDSNGGGRYRIEVRNLGDVHNVFRLNII